MNRDMANKDKAKNRLVKCRTAGCDALCYANGSTGLCKSCIAIHGGGYSRAKRPVERHYAIGKIRGCQTSVAADTLDQARSMLRAMGGRVSATGRLS